MLRFACRDPDYIIVLVWGYFEPLLVAIFIFHYSMPAKLFL